MKTLRGCKNKKRLPFSVQYCTCGNFTGSSVACTIDRRLDMEDLNTKMFKFQEEVNKNLINAFGMFKAPKLFAQMIRPNIHTH